MKLISLAVCISLCHFVLAQEPSIQWQKSLGGSDYDRANCVRQTSDGGYIVAGASSSDDGDVSGNHNSNFSDFWVVKLSAYGNIQWQKMLGSYGFEDDVATSLQQTTDGGYIVVGSTYSDGGDITGHHGDYNSRDYWVVKLGETGHIQWQKSLGGTSDDKASDVIQTSDGGYMIAGSSASNDDDVSGHHGVNDWDYWVVKLDVLGSIQWQKSLGGSGNDEAYSIKQTDEGDYILAGTSTSNDGDATGNHGGADMWVLKLNESGVIKWQKSLGGSGEDGAYSVYQTTDGGVGVAGFSGLNSGNVSVNKGNSDYWFVNLDSAGNLQWEKSLGGSAIDMAYSVQQTSNGAFILAGTSSSTNGDVTGNHGSSDFWVVQLDSSGNVNWQKALGGTLADEAKSIQETSNGGYIIAGSSNSNNGDVTGNHGSKDFWVVKLTFNATMCPGTILKTITTGPVIPAASYQWQVNTGNGFVDLSNNTTYSGVTTNVLSIHNPPTSFYGYRYQCVITKSGKSFTSDAVSLVFAVNWTGALSTIWGNTANWSCGVLPDANTDVIVPSGLTNYPEINANLSIRSLWVSPLASVSIAPGVLLDLKGK